MTRAPWRGAGPNGQRPSVEGAARREPSVISAAARAWAAVCDFFTTFA